MNTAEDFAATAYETYVRKTEEAGKVPLTMDQWGKAMEALIDGGDAKDVAKAAGTKLPRQKAAKPAQDATEAVAAGTPAAGPAWARTVAEERTRAQFQHIMLSSGLTTCADKGYCSLYETYAREGIVHLLRKNDSSVEAG